MEMLFARLTIKEEWLGVLFLKRATVELGGSVVVHPCHDFWIWIASSSWSLTD